MEQPLLENKNVLVVEDNMINQLIVKHSLDKLGAKVELTDTGLNAIEKLQASSDYDLVLMDIQLPGLTGYETTSYIRNQLRSDIPIIAMTAFALQGEEEKCKSSGMDGYVSKPFTIEGLFASIKDVLEKKKAAYHNPYIISSNNVAVDISMLYEISGDDPAYINSMISTFLDNMPSTIKKMEENLAGKDFESLYKNAHYAKSSLSVIKVSDCYTIVQEIEQVAKKKPDEEALSFLIKQVKDKYAIAEQILQERLSTVA